MSEFQMPYRNQNSNKGTFGKVLNVAGSENYIGSAYLSSLSAYKTGAGYVALASCEKVLNSVSKMLPEVILLNRKEALKSLDKYDILLIGCGLGRGKSSEQDFKHFIRYGKSKPVIIDADGLNILAKNSEIPLSKDTVITPHPAEAGRLLGIKTEEILIDVEKSAKILSEKYNCVTVLKTHRTVVCSKTGEIYINEHGNSALAKAGTGDVLTGIIAGLIAQGMGTLEASKLGVYLHSVSGEIASQELTEYSVMASDLPNYLPQAIKTLI